MGHFLTTFAKHEDKAASGVYRCHEESNLIDPTVWLF